MFTEQFRGGQLDRYLGAGQKIDSDFFDSRRVGVSIQRLKQKSNVVAACPRARPVDILPQFPLAKSRIVVQEVEDQWTAAHRELLPFVIRIAFDIGSLDTINDIAASVAQD